MTGSPSFISELADTRTSVSERANCAAINSNQSLQSTYAGIYENLPSGSTNSTNGPPSNPNKTSSPGQSSYPNVTTGTQQLVNAWISICDSPAYTALYEQWGPTHTFGGSQLNGTTGHFQTFYGFNYPTPCTASGNSSCGYATTWYVDLVTGNISGPWLTEDGTPLGSAPGMSASPTSLDSPIIVVSLVALVAIVAAAGTLGYIGLQNRRGRVPGTTLASPPAAALPFGRPTSGGSVSDKREPDSGQIPNQTDSLADIH
jgi:hypothetical protein